MNRARVMLTLVMLDATVALTQEADTDPLMGNYRFGQAANVVVTWGEYGPSPDAFRAIYDYLSFGNPAVPDSLITAGARRDSGAEGISGGEAMDAASGDFDGDDKDDVVFAWEGMDRSIVFVFPAVDAAGLTITADSRAELASAGSLADPSMGAASQLRLVTGFFDLDPQEELVLAFLAPDGYVTTRIYDTDGARSPRLLSEVRDFKLPQGPTGTFGQSARFDVATGDLDADGDDEIVLAGGRLLGNDPALGKWEVGVRVYDVDTATSSITFRADTVIYAKSDNSSRWLSRIAVACGRLTDAPQEQIAVAFEDAANDATVYWYLQPIEAAPGLGRLVSNTSNRFFVESNLGNHGYALSLACADLDRDGRDEIVHAGRTLKVLSADSTLTIRSIAGGGFGSDPGEQSRRWMVVADLDADADLSRDSTDWTPEIVLASNRTVSDDGGINVDGEIQFGVFSYTAGQFNLRRRLENAVDRVDQSAVRQLVLAAADFGAKGIRVGAPKRYARTDIVQPLVILNAPPIHFDLLGATFFDVTGCATGGCAFTASYETMTERKITMSTEFKRDWSVGAEVSGTVVIPKLKIPVEASLELTYGQNFSRSTTATQTFTINQTVAAILDDQIYAAIVDYDLWEYPLISNGSQEGYLLVTIPKLRSRAWFDSKSWSANSYVPPHEVGQILSYKEIALPSDNPLLAEQVRWSAADRYTIGGSTSYQWGLTAETQTETRTQFGSHFKIGASASFDVPVRYIPKFKLSGDYSRDSLTSQTSSVTDEKGLSVTLGSANLTYGNTRYAVTPYVYWARNGALVLDYIVSPELSAPGFDPTWWQLRYGNLPDPTFILPWRNDRARGLSVSDAQVEQTRDILFEPANPAPGENVRAKVRVQNFSLLPTQGSVRLRLYMGHPDSGGVPIRDTDGEIDRITSGPIAARGNAVLETEFAAPSDQGQFVRIYAVVDPDGTMPEILENNNRGWTVLALGPGTTSIASDGATIPAGVTLFQNYPNPFNPSTSIRYRLPATEHVRLIVYDLLGREVEVLVDERQGPGSYSVTFPTRRGSSPVGSASGMASGAYIARLTAGNSASSRSMLLLK